MNDLTLITALQQLITENTVISSRFNKKQQQYLDALVNAGLIKLNRQGRGFVYQVIKLTELQNHLKKLQPLDESELTADLPQRSRNIGLYKNSKQVNPEHEVYYLLLKAVGGNIYWFNDENNINISEQTVRQGVSGLMIQENDNWQSHHPLLFIENQALFNRLDWLPSNFNGSVIYYGGHINNLLLSWLANKPRATDFIVFPDYDGVGFNNFLRVRRVITACHFYLIPDWKNKLSLFGNSAIWQNNQVLFNNAVCELNNINALTDELKDLIRMMRSSGKGLEQESVWLSIGESEKSIKSI